MRPRVALLGQPRDGIGDNRIQGSVAIVLSNLARQLGESCEVVAVAPQLDNQDSHGTTSGGLEVHRVPVGSRRIEKGLELLDPRSLPRILRPGCYHGYFERAAAKLAEIGPDLVHVMTFAQAAPVLRRRLPDVPLVLHLHDAMLARVDPALAAERLAPFSAIVTCSEWLAHVLRIHVPAAAARIWPIGNGVDPALFQAPARAQWDGPLSRLLMVGRISPEKGPHVLIDAFCQIAADYPELELELAGPLGLLPLAQARQACLGAPAMQDAVDRFYGGFLAGIGNQLLHPADRLRQRLEASIPASLRPRVRMAGGRSHAQITEAYRAADILVQPSVWQEPFGLPVAEGMAMGLPVIASNEGGPTDLVRHGETGLFVPPGDAPALARAIRELLDDPPRARAMGAAGRERAMRALTWHSVAERLLGVYEGILPDREALAVPVPPPADTADQVLVQPILT